MTRRYTNSRLPYLKLPYLGLEHIKFEKFGDKRKKLAEAYIYPIMTEMIIQFPFESR